MRRANKLGLLGLAIALAAAFGLISGLHSTSKVQAQIVGQKNCGNPSGGSGGAGTFTPGASFVCTFAIVSATSVTGTWVDSIGINTAFNITSYTIAGTGCTVGAVTALQATVTCTAGTTQLVVSEGVTVLGTGVAGQGLFDQFVCSSAVTACGTLGTSAQLQTVVGNCGPSSNAVTWGGTCFGVTHQPTGEVKYCNNTTSTVGLSQVIGGTQFPLSVNGPATTFTIPVFGGASTCWIQLTQNGVSCNAVTVLCTDGFVVVSLTTPGSSAVISCSAGTAAAVVPAGQAFAGAGAGTPTPLVALNNNGGACQSQTSGTSLLIPCGVTAGTNPAPSPTSWTCSSVLFDIASFLTGCLNGQTVVQSCPLGSNAYTLTGGTATVTVSFLATAPGGGPSGGIVLGQNTFSFQAPGVGTLLVTATPQLIPSNGTLASVITATFACGSGFALTATGFPLSSVNGNVLSTNQSILGLPPGLANGSSAVCGAGLPGSFTFATPGEVLFDNGRTQESVGCGLNGQQNLFGGSSLFNPNNLNPTLPLAFTCTGAAVLAIGGGAAGDAPINVTYASSVGGLTAVGSTLITVAPSGVPRISVACNPSTIAAGNTGSLCTATVTDQNGTPMTGSSGATVTWTVSDTTVAQILPCVVNLGAVNGASALNITTSPNVIPQIVPNTPCNPPSGSIPGQSVTFLNGQTTALLVASSYAHPEVVTVSAVLGVLVPPEYACEVTPYIPVGYGQAQFLGSSAPSGYLPGLTGCGAGNPVGATGLASALSTAGSVALNGIITLPNATSASTTVSIGGPAGILIVGATSSFPLGLQHGCNNIIVTSTAGTPTANIAALVSPSAALVSIWAFNNSTKQFRAAFFSDPSAPVDFNVTGNTGSSQQGGGAQAGANGLGQTSANVANGTQVTESYFVCVNQAAEIISG